VLIDRDHIIDVRKLSILAFVLSGVTDAAVTDKLYVVASSFAVHDLWSLAHPWLAMSRSRQPVIGLLPDS
jgi:hypothetical protein